VVDSCFVLFWVGCGLDRWLWSDLLPLFVWIDVIFAT